MNILHVISSLDARAGGPPAALRGLALAQKIHGLGISVATTHRADQEAAFEEELKDAGITIHSVGPVHSKLGTHPNLRRTLAKAISETDILHIHGIWEDIQHKAAVEARKQGRPYIISPHGMLDPWSLNQRAMKKKLYLAWRMRRDLNCADGIHCCSRIERDLIRPLELKPPTIVEPNGLDLNEFNPLPEPGRFRSRYPEIAGRRIVLFLSRLHYKKGLDLLIPAFAQAEVPDTVLVLAGPCEASYRQKLDRIAKEANIKDNILFAGMQHGPERIEAFVDANIFALPSYQENFGIVVTESLASGTPVLISDQVNIWPDIDDAGVGLICETNITSITNTLKSALANEPIASSDRCREVAANHYDWRMIAKRWSETLEKVAAACA